MSKPLEPLSERELDILRLLADGLSNPDIAESLSIAVGTVKVHLRSIYNKLNVSDRDEAVARAKALRLVQAQHHRADRRLSTQTIHHLPAQPNRFIGREDELAKLVTMLGEPSCRLLTLVGTGGIGKTRLAMQVMLEAQHDFADGIYWISLQSVNGTQFLASALADGVECPRFSQDDPRAQLLRFLRDKAMLIVLDNFEHLIDAADLIVDILDRTRRVKLLVTSREVLNVRPEWIWTVTGLRFPDDLNAPLPETYSAVQLFAERARQIRPDFVLTNERAHVIRICQLVEGLPLALELAVSWLKLLPCATIADEIQHNLDFLTTSLRDLPPRHRSMRAVFAQSWALLPPQERAVLNRLSVFQGGFTVEAAEQVGGATLPLLSALVDKSLIRHDPNGRYQIHELLRQYAAEQLAQSSTESQQAHDSHAVYFMDLLHQREPLLSSARQHETIRQLEAELDNIRAAWWRTVQTAHIDALQKGAFAYYLLSDMRGRYQESIDAVEKAISQLESITASEARDFVLAILHNTISGPLIRLGRFEEARTAAQKSITLYDVLGRRPPHGLSTEPLGTMGLVAVIVGDYDEAMVYGEKALQRIEASDKLNLAFALYIVANAAYLLGQYESAIEYGRKAYQITDALGDAYFGSYILVVLGNVALAMEDYQRAWEYYRTSYVLKEDFNEFGGMAFALNSMARIAWLRRDYHEAQRLYQLGHDFYREVSDPGGLATSLLGLGDTAQARGDILGACSSFQQALKIAVQIQWTPLILSIFAAVSDLLIQMGDVEQTMELLTLVMQHPASEQLIKIRAQQSLETAVSKFPAQAISAARWQNRNLYEIASSLQEKLSARPMVQAYSPAPSGNNSEKTRQPAGDALSERELEILRLLANGMSNQEIADHLVVVLGTVKAHNHNIFSKLGAKNRVQAITRARELNLL